MVLYKTSKALDIVNMVKQSKGFPLNNLFFALCNKSDATAVERSSLCKHREA